MAWHGTSREAPKEDSTQPEQCRVGGLLRSVCVYCFGEPERQSASHIIFKPPKWAGQPTVNIQPLGKQAKGYQVREVLKLIEKSPRGRR